MNKCATSKKAIPLLLAAMLSAAVVPAQDKGFQQPVPELLQLADVELPPVPVISRNNKWMVFLQRKAFKSFEDLGENELKLGGLRINPELYSPTRSNYYTGIEVKQLPDASTFSIKGLPEKMRISNLSFSPDEKLAAFIQKEETGLSLWVINLVDGSAKCLVKEGLNAVLGSPFQWSKKDGHLLVKLRGSGSIDWRKQTLPTGPAIQQAAREKAAARTYQDLLKNPEDENRFRHFVTCSWVEINAVTGVQNALLPEGLWKRISFSPDGQYFIAEHLTGTFSYALPYSLFPSEFKLYQSNGTLVKVIESRPLQDKMSISFDAVEAGKRAISWRDDKPHQLFWVQAPDQGDPSKPSEIRDVLYLMKEDFSSSYPIDSLKHRFAGIQFHSDNLAIVQDSWRKNRQTQTYAIQPGNAEAASKVLFSLSTEDKYQDPGSFLMTSLKSGDEVLQRSKDGRFLYLQGEGFSPQGNRPFLDQYELATGKRTTLWRAEGKTTYERIVRVVAAEQVSLITSIESPTTYPNLWWKEGKKRIAPRQISFRENPWKAMAGVTKKKIQYLRKDGVNLSATLYLPAGYQPQKDGRLPLLMEAYPTEFKDDKAAGQITSSPFAFTSLSWASPVYWVMRGFAVLENAQFPIIGKGDAEPNDTYITQLVANAEAAIQAVDSMGIVDPKRCAVMGHSYGAFMTANLLAHSNLFAAGIARSGAYNRTLTPFGFQAEDRNYWQATKVYQEMSPFNYANQIKSSLLLIHGDADNNPGTFTLQSERMFQAIKGLGGDARLVLLPLESHSYAAKENILHMLWEMDNWLISKVKNKK